MTPRRKSNPENSPAGRGDGTVPGATWDRDDPHEAALRILDRVSATDTSQCGMGCGEMGSCHVNVNEEARLLAEVFLGRRKP